MEQNKYSHDDANPTYRIIKRTFVFAIGTMTGLIMCEDKPIVKVGFPDTFVVKDIEAKCVMYSHIKLQGVLRANDKRVYLN